MNGDMKKEFLTSIIAVISVLNICSFASDFRLVKDEVFDAENSAEWFNITIPAGSELKNYWQIHYTGQITPMEVSLEFPHSLMARQWVTARISNFPYDPNQFRQLQNRGIVTRGPISIRVFPLSHPITNFNSLGEMTITPARPIFDCGIPISEEAAKEIEAQKSKPTQPVQNPPFVLTDEAKSVCGIYQWQFGEGPWQVMDIRSDGTIFTYRYQDSNPSFEFDKRSSQWSMAGNHVFFGKLQFTTEGEDLIDSKGNRWERTR
jgi:hypothetical protein